MVELSPFPYQGPLEPEGVAGRIDLQRDLRHRLEQRRLTALLGPRRYGKTSILRRVTADMADDGYETVWIDLYELSSMADLAGALDRGLAQTQGKLRRAVEGVAGSLSLKLGLLGVELSKSARDRPDPVLKVRSMVQLLVTVAQKRKLIVVLDEFSGIADVPKAAGVLRTELQHHYRDLSIVFAGSQPSTMTMLFADRAQPFFSQAELLDIPPLTTSEVTDLVHDGFRRTGRDAGPIAPRLAAAAEGHPQRAMQLADACWSRVRKGTAATDQTWIAAHDDVRRSVDDASERFFTLFPTGHQKVLRIVAGGGSVFGTAASSLSLAPGTAQAALAALLGSADLARRDDRLVVVDPLFADWIRRRFPV
ncbi:MAG TPA: hypothetical protein VNS19_11055 [Acidimicrobiales bacterium]|nr:hypothetical protein [Acidimicrobiales bacterium]